MTHKSDSTEDLQLRLAGLEAMLSDAQAEIGELSAKLERAYAALRPFAVSYRQAMQLHGKPIQMTLFLSPDDFVRAAELVPEDSNP